jgi:hypothetical protein
MLISDACDKKVEKVATNYLCDKCSKEYAMNMSEFINSLQIEYEDFEKVGEIGFVNGISI